WHGANWTFIVWGALNAIYFLPLLLANKNRNHLEVVAFNRKWPSLKALLNILLTFGLTTLAWIFFRAENINHAFQYLKGIFNKSLFSMPELRPTNILVLLIVFIAMEWLGRRNQYAIETFGLQWKRPLRLAFYYTIIILIFLFSRNEKTFIYFQFYYMKQFLTNTILFLCFFYGSVLILLLSSNYLIVNHTDFKLKPNITIIVLGNSHPPGPFNDSLISNLKNLA